MEVDVKGLINKLCQHFARKIDVTQHILDKHEFTTKLEERLKKKAFDALFSHQFGLHRVAGSGDHHVTNELSERNRLLVYAYNLRCNNRVKDAEMIEKLLQDLEEHFGDRDSLKPYLGFLLHLTDSVPRPSSPGLTLGGSDDHYYSIQKALAAKPGTDISGFGFFNREQKDIPTHNSLFGGLVQSWKALRLGVEVKLDLPDIEDRLHYGLTPAKPGTHYGMHSDDEGFGDGSTPSSGGYDITKESQNEVNIFDEALKVKRHEYYTWENLGKIQIPEKKYYLTEAGPDAVDEIYDIINKNTSLVTGLNGPSRRTISPLQLVEDVRNILLGLPSHTFLFDEVSGEFHIEPGSCISGLTPQGVEQLCSQAVQCGTDYCQLCTFSKPVVMDSQYDRGLISQAFADGIRNYLQYYRAQVLLIPADLTVLQLLTHSSPHMTQIRYLAKLCKVDCKKSPGNEPEGSVAGDALPTGIQLLSYLYNESVNSAWSTKNYTLLLSLLTAACRPYIMFLQDWVFHGICRDLYSEFMITLQDQYIGYRDRHYWTHVFIQSKQESGDVVPIFLQQMSDDIFVCGKSINLLQLCAPKHFLFGVDVQIPRVEITFSQEELVAMTTDVEMYVSYMNQVARHKALTREQMKERLERTRQELIDRARDVALERNHRINKQILARRMVEDAKKRRNLQELKENMQKDLRRRLAEKEEKQEEDAAYMESINKQESIQTTIDAKLEEEAKQELIAYYGQLSEEATFRELKATWKVRRARLETARMNFIEKDNSLLREELEKNPYIPGMPMAGSSAVDSSMESVYRLLDSTVSLDSTILQPQQLVTNADTNNMKDDPQSDDHHMSGLPQWASQTYTGTKIVTDEDKVDDVEDNMPKWAKKAVESDDHDPVFVEDSEDYLDKEMSLSKRALPNWAHTNLFASETDETKGKEDSIQKASEFGHASDETEAKEDAIRKASEFGHSSDETKAKEDTIKKASEFGHASDETKAKEETIKKASEFGHASDETKVKEDTVKKASEFGHASDETKVKEDTIKKASEFGHASDETKAKEDTIKKASEFGHASDETTAKEDTIKKASEFGHASDETKAKEDTIKKASEFGHASDETKAKEDTIKKASDFGHASDETKAKEDTIKKASEFGHTSDETKAKVGTIRKASEFGHTSDETKAKEDTIKKASEFGHASDETKAKEDTIKKASEFGHSSDQSTPLSDTERLKKFKELNKHGHHASEETTQTDEKPKVKPKVGHTSDQSQQVDTDANRLQKFKELNKLGHPSMESAAYDIQEHGLFYKPLRQKYQAFPSAQQAKSAQPQQKPHTSDESKYEDPDRVKLRKFRERNIKGHSSDSSVQRLLYEQELAPDSPQKIHKITEEEGESETPDVNMFADGSQQFKYTTDFKLLDDAPMVDLMKNTVEDPIMRGLKAGSTDVKAHEYLTLPVLLTRSITIPLQAQIDLVNKCTVDYFIAELKINDHFTALRQYLLMEDGEFCETLSNQLFEKLGSSPEPSQILNPVFLNNTLKKALGSSLKGDRGLGSNISFIVNYIPTAFQQNEPNVLDCLGLKYQAEWPLNIIITESCMTKYTKIFTFMLSLKRIVWVLKDIFSKLKRDGSVYNAQNAAELRQLQLYRHEMQHFVKVMQGYIANQIIHVTWQEFQTELADNMHNVDDLHHKHADYLNKAVFRCLINKRARPVMKIIEDIFTLILKFRTQLLSASWERHPVDGQPHHQHFEQMTATYKTFKEYSLFLFKVVNKLASRGYQTHLQELLLSLNFNGHYKA
ncbi:unnamed protein product [Owenia fusiformis]|uniref:Gamma-tubulin complex component 6 n=1 Tax=Owenia fusiformis TaxID=6347 RepID=A0A8J1T5N8_OWEFU|nr:unnamed protein product [Owenia fusiformis]